jgi:hypothetical protein
MSHTSQKVRVIIAREEGLPLSHGSGDGSLKREIPKGHEFDSKAIKPLARTLFSSSVALGHAVTAYKEFARIKSSSISPDGMLGGKGYVLRVKDIRAKFQQACELLSALTDTLHDELHGPHWSTKVLDVGKNDAEDIKELLGESDEILEDPERFGDKEIKDIEENKDSRGGAPKTKETKDQIKELESRLNETEASRLPDAGGKDITEATPAKSQGVKQASNWKASSEWGILANSSVPVDTLPGPRVNHLDRGEQTGPGGSFNRDEPLVEDDWGRSEGAPPKTLNNVWGSIDGWGASGLPADVETRTEARDFGVGYGAKGEGSEGYGTQNSDGRGVWGPQSILPNDPKSPIKDPGGIPFGGGPQRDFWGMLAESELPFDGPDPVARSDYYEGNKGNLVNINPHPNRPVAQSEMPGEESSNYNYDRDLPNTGQVYEQQAVPYVKRDWTTHSDRNDMQDLYSLNNSGPR